MNRYGTFTRGLLLGAGFLCLMGSSRLLGKALGVAALVYGANRALQLQRESRDQGRLAPNYAYLR